ncbi:MAG: acyl-CoA thioesterase [marine bacterium B5-7]|nr:MAG: acyl-CoA thioesterase [marine bacterium B5-7]
MNTDSRPAGGIPSLRTVAMPADANANGDIFGGWLMSQMDLAGGTYASHIAAGRVVTIAVDAMTFYKPVHVGDQVSCYCTTDKLGRTSIAVRIETWVIRRGSPEHSEEKVTEALYTFVAVDAAGIPRPISQS